MKSIIIGICVFGCYAFAKAQFLSPEIGRFSYTLIPDMGDVQMERYQLKGMVGKKIRNGFIGFGVSYEHNDFVFKGFEPSFDVSSYSEMQVISSQILYRHNFQKNWSFFASLQPVLSSNFSGSISEEDFQFNSLVNVSKTWGSNEKNTQLAFGVLYGTILGEPRLFPTIQYIKKVNEKFSYAIGLPRTGVYYKYSHHAIGLQLIPNGLYSNNSDSVAIPELGVLRNTKLQMNGIGIELEHNYQLDKFFSTSIRVGYLLEEELSILDIDNNTIYTFNTTPSPTISMGLKININNKK